MQISDTNKKELLALTPEDINRNLMHDMFANRAKRENGKIKIIKSKYNTTDTFYLEPKEYFVKTKTLTTVGRFIYNKLIIERDFQNVVGYMNEPIDADKQKAIEGLMSEALLNDVITVEQFGNYLNRIQWLSLQFNHILCSSFSEKSIFPLPKVMAARDKFTKDNREKLDNGDVATAVKMEQDLVKLAKEELAGDPAMDLYNSGARGSFKNNYKGMYIAKGPIKNLINGKWDIVEKSFSEGLDKKDIQPYGNSLVGGQYSKSLGTPVAGYLFKRINAAFQAIVGDENPESDCGTKLTIKFDVTDKNKKKLLDRFIVEGGKTVLITPKNVDKYVGKTVNLRSTMYCQGAKKCSRCLGMRFYKVGVKNVGLISTRVATTILKMNMKKFHDSTASLYDINFNDITL